MTPVQKLLKKEFKLESEEELLKRIEKQNELFFTTNFFTDKPNYVSMIKELCGSINSLGRDYSECMEMAKSGSIMYGAFTSAGVGSIQKEYRDKRKQLKNHVRFFI